MASQTSPWQQEDDPIHDIGPWIECPNSTRANRYRYDYAARSLQVSWRNGKGHVVTSYYGVDSEGYRRFARAVSKGKYVNRVLNGYAYAPSTPDEVNAPSNPNRRAVQSKP